jgi:anthranilate synthase/aminodeoxychorismate synthase-like glutamine amidotransferase
MIDNYDSFVYNLYQYFLILGEEVCVVRNDKITAKDVEVLNPSCLVISPGPCTPREAGISVELIQKFYNRFPILGICLGNLSFLRIKQTYE